MQLGKALIGAIIGGLLGIAALIAIQHFTGIDKTWLAIVVALLTGLGVRAMVSTTGHTSYVRGALTGLLALAAYCGGTQLYSQLAQRDFLAKQVQATPTSPAPEAVEPKVSTESESGAAAEKESPAETTPSAEGDKETPDENEKVASTEPETQAEVDGVAVTIKPVQPNAPMLSHDALSLKSFQIRPSSPWDYLWLTVAALIAYELGRGSAPPLPKQPIIPPPDAT